MTPGTIVRVQGYEFEVVRAWEVASHVPDLWNFEGKCTPNPVNDPIRHTGYNGGVYSWRAPTPLTRPGAGAQRRAHGNTPRPRR